MKKINKFLLKKVNNFIKEIKESDKSKVLILINTIFFILIHYCQNHYTNSIYAIMSLYCISECFRFEIEDIFINEFKYKRILYGFIFYLVFPFMGLISGSFYGSVFFGFTSMIYISILQKYKII